MTLLHGYMAADHKTCDEAFVAVESAVANAQWDTAKAAWSTFETHLLRHFAMEEQVLFPAIEQRTGMTEGPTAVMRFDHEQMRALLPTLAERLQTTDGPGFLGVADTMMVMIQQHNMKEEQVLYPMADQVLEDPEKVVIEMQSGAEPTNS